MTRLGGRIVALAAAAACTLAISSCGGSEPRQDEAEPTGKFPVDVYKSTFPHRQRLAEATDLVIGVENTGEKTIPELAITIKTDGKTATTTGPGAASFYVQVDEPGLANPSRPVWILENKYPIVAEHGAPDTDQLPKGSSPCTVAQTSTFGCGELAPGERREILWHVTPVRAGTYTVDYELSAGLYGKAEAVTADGSPPEGKFVVTITDKPPKARVNDAGQVEIED